MWVLIYFWCEGCSWFGCLLSLSSACAGCYHLDKEYASAQILNSCRFPGRWGLQLCSVAVTVLFCKPPERWRRWLASGHETLAAVSGLTRSQGSWPWCGLAAVAGHASSWRGGGIDLHPFVCRTLGNGSGSSPCLPLESEMVVTTCTHPWNLCGPPISIWRKKLLWYPSPLAPLNSGPLCFWRTQASSWAPSVVVFYLVAPSDCLHTANSSSVLWAWPPKPKPQYTSSTCPSGWLDKHFRLWGSGLSWLCPLHICCWAFLWSSIPPSLFQLISSVRGLPSVQKPFPLWQLPPRGKGPVRIPFFIFSFLLPCPVMQRFSCSFGSLSSGIVQ